MESYIKWMDSQSKVVKIILCLWILDITWAIYRIVRAVVKKNMVHLILGILWIIAAGTVGWILDIIWILVYNRIFWFND